MRSSLSGSPEIISAVLSHTKVLTALHQACFVPGWAVNDVFNLLSSPGTDALAAIEGVNSTEEPGPVKGPSGFIMYKIMADQCDIITLCVHPEIRRRGTAHHLLNAMEHVLVERGISKVFLEVRESNAGAIRLYEQLGYMRTGHRKNYYRHRYSREDALLYRKELASIT